MLNCGISLQYIQIYNDKITDLISGKDVFLRDNNLRNSSEVVVNELNDFLSILAIGEKRKIFAETKMNEHSSRAHTIIIATLNQKLKNRDTMVNSTL
mmetsp:Transcript_66544/g.143521  ORF Transcript_66544/g.143521 Transcript_66544/m.143521 type:complete len:97 (-) Transcript_66544:421-711(-)